MAEPITYLLVDWSGIGYIIWLTTDRVPDFLHYGNCLFGGYIPRIHGLADKHHVHCDERVPEPLCIDPVWKFLVLRRPFQVRACFAGCRCSLNNEFLITIRLKLLYYIEK